MANFSLYSWLDSKATSFGTNSSIVLFTIDEIIIESADAKLVLQGTGFTNDAGDQFSGTIESLRLYEMDISGAAPAQRLAMESTTPLSLSVQGLMDTLSSPYSGKNSFDYLLSGDDSVTGSAGNDNINGQQGNDTIVGNDGDDYLAGGFTSYDPTGLSAPGDDSLVGGNGNDTLNGGDGKDTMVGGAGDDFYIVEQADDVIIEAVNGGRDRVQITTSMYMAGSDNLSSYTLPANVENLDLYHYVFAGSGMDLLFTARGNALANKISVAGDGMAGGGAEYLYGLGGNDRLYSGSGNDTLDGGSGNDTMIGGSGSDTYIVDSLGDLVSENTLAAGYDADTVVVQIAAAQTWSLGGNVVNAMPKKVFTGIENLTLGDAASMWAQNAIGDEADNALIGNAGANKLYGVEGNDTLVGGAGADTLAGGAGHDRFVFNTAADSGLDAARDVIKDFAPGDLIDLHAIDANSATPLANEGFVFIGKAAFSSTDATGQLRYAAGVLYGSTDADAQAEFEIAFANKPSLTVSDFLL